MVGKIGGSSAVVPVRAVSRLWAGARPVGAPQGGRSDWVDIANFSAVDVAVSPALGAASKASAGDGALGEVAGYLGELRALVAPDSEDHSPEAERSRQVKADGILASIDRIARSAQFDGSPLLGGSTVVSSTSGNVTLPAGKTEQLGEVIADGKRLALADLRSGGAVALESDTGRRIIDSAIQTIRGSRQQISQVVGGMRSSAAPSMDDLAAIRESILAGASAAMREPNRAAMVHLLQ